MPIAAIGIIGSVVGGALASHSAGKAANAQSQAAMSAAQLEHDSAEKALAFQKQQYADQQKNMAPWLQAGTGAINQLSSDLQGGVYKDWTGQFQAPTELTEQNDPGFQARLKMGSQALERSAAARGGVLSGGTAKALNQYSQDYASNEYSNVYNRAFNEYATKYNEFQTGQANRFNRYASLAGVGQQTANTLGLAGQNYANQSGNILMTSANQQGNALQAAAAARASGYAAQGNIWGNVIGQATGYGQDIWDYYH